MPLKAHISALIGGIITSMGNNYCNTASSETIISIKKMHAHIQIADANTLIL